ncbi:hypothetical protein ACFYNL_08530 [Streptomyces sp. NPDC007808]
MRAPSEISIRSSPPLHPYYDRTANGTPKPGVNPLNWSSGWPVAY